MYWIETVADVRNRQLACDCRRFVTHQHYQQQYEREGHHTSVTGDNMVNGDVREGFLWLRLEDESK